MEIISWPPSRGAMTPEARAYYYPRIATLEPKIEIVGDAATWESELPLMPYDWSVMVSVEQLASLTIEQALCVVSGVLRLAPVGQPYCVGALEARWPGARGFGYRPLDVTFDLTYPLDKVARVTVAPYMVGDPDGAHSMQMSLAYVLWQGARAYRTIYENHAAYGVWGDAFADLWIQSVWSSDNGSRARFVISG